MGKVISEVREPIPALIISDTSSNFLTLPCAKHSLNPVFWLLINFCWWLLFSGIHLIVLNLSQVKPLWKSYNPCSHRRGLGSCVPHFGLITGQCLLIRKCLLKGQNEESIRYFQYFFNDGTCLFMYNMVSKGSQTSILCSNTDGFTLIRNLNANMWTWYTTLAKTV